MRRATAVAVLILLPFWAGGCSDDDSSTPTQPASAASVAASAASRTTNPPPSLNTEKPTTTATTKPVEVSASSAPPSPTMPLACSQSDVMESLDVGAYLVVGCDEQWAVLQMYPTCNGAPCEQTQLLAVWGGPDDDYQLGYNTYPFSYCRDRVAHDGAPTWLLDSVPWPNCDGDEAPIEYHDEPTNGALRRGDHGPRVATLQRSLVEGEFSGVFPADGYFGWNTERAVRSSQHASQLPLTGVADEAYLQDRSVPVAPCLATTPFDARVAITLTGDVTCELASQRWSDYLSPRGSRPTRGVRRRMDLHPRPRPRQRQRQLLAGRRTL